MVIISRLFVLSKLIDTDDNSSHCYQHRIDANTVIAVAKQISFLMRSVSFEHVYLEVCLITTKGLLLPPLLLLALLQWNEKRSQFRISMRFLTCCAIMMTSMQLITKNPNA